MLTTKQFQKYVYQQAAGRWRELPWRQTDDPYAILVSEVMLQQTQVERVIPKYQAFLEQFPTVVALTQAKVSEVLAAWQGLGYGRRALALKKAAQIIVDQYQGVVPNDLGLLRELPGVGEYTAAAVRVFAYNQPEIMIETNIRRVYIHHFFADSLSLGERVDDRRLRPYILQTLDKDRPRYWFNSLMDYGSDLGRQIPNPNRHSQQYKRQAPFQGSNRQLRGQLLQLLIECKEIRLAEVMDRALDPVGYLKIVEQLEREGFIVREGRKQKSRIRLSEEK